MQINLTGKNLEITPAIKSYAEEKMKHHVLDRFSHITNVHMVLHIDNIDHVAEASLHFHGSEIHASAKAVDMYQAIDALMEKLSGQVNKHKEKMIESHR